MSRGERLIHVSRELIADFITDSEAYTTNVPEDVELEELWHHQDGFGYVLRVSSSEWEPLEEGERIPVYAGQFTETGEDDNTLEVTG